MGATITLRRRLEWADTDAAGVWHHSVVWRLLEQAEAELHRHLGISDRTFGHTPRRHVEAEFMRPVRFDDEMEIQFRVARVGRTSVTYAMEVAVDEGLAASVTLTAVLVGADGKAVLWPEEMRSSLLSETPVP